MFLLKHMEEEYHIIKYFIYMQFFNYVILTGTDRLCGLVVRVPAYRYRGTGSIPGTTRFSEK
jgi:hypothetical protein